MAQSIFRDSGLLKWNTHPSFKKITQNYPKLFKIYHSSLKQFRKSEASMKTSDSVKNNVMSLFSLSDETQLKGAYYYSCGSQTLLKVGLQLYVSFKNRSKHIQN